MRFDSIYVLYAWLLNFLRLVERNQKYWNIHSPLEAPAFLYQTSFPSIHLIPNTASLDQRHQHPRHLFRLREPAIEQSIKQEKFRSNTSEWGKMVEYRHGRTEEGRSPHLEFRSGSVVAR